MLPLHVACRPGCTAQIYVLSCNTAATPEAELRRIGFMRRPVALGLGRASGRPSRRRRRHVYYVLNYYIKPTITHQTSEIRSDSSYYTHVARHSILIRYSLYSVDRRHLHSLLILCGRTSQVRQVLGVTARYYFTCTLATLSCYSHAASVHGSSRDGLTRSGLAAGSGGGRAL